MVFQVDSAWLNMHNNAGRSATHPNHRLHRGEVLAPPVQTLNVHVAVLAVRTGSVLFLLFLLHALAVHFLVTFLQSNDARQMSSTHRVGGVDIYEYWRLHLMYTSINVILPTCQVEFYD